MILAAKAATSTAQVPLAYQWVAVGHDATNGRIFTSTSTTASSWTSRTSSFGTSEVYGVATDKFSYVAVGNGGKIASSPDGITWTQQTSPFAGTGIYAVARGTDGYWVAVGGSGKMAYSTNGSSWTSKNGLGLSVTEELYVVAFGNGLWAIGGSAGGLWTATDPTGTWTSRTSTISAFGNGYNCSIHYAKSQSIWVLGNDSGTTGALASSTDGLTWTARTSTISNSATGSCFVSNTSVCARAGFAAGPITDIETTTDGTTYTNRTPAWTNQLIKAGASDDSGLLAVAGQSTGGKIQTSSDGTTWTDRSAIDANTQIFGLIHSSGTPSQR